MPWSEESSAWVTLSRTPGLSRAGLLRALESLGSAHAITAASDQSRERASIPNAARCFLSSADALPSARERNWLDASNHHIIPFTDGRYPAPLRASRWHPLTLYVAGDAGILGAPQLAVVGSRNPTPQGRATARDFASRLAASGLVISSGLAVGIDAEAHRGALAAGGRTLAVLGCGVDMIYPHAHSSLARQIECGGALVSGFALGTAPRRQHFPQRNATIAALSLATLVVEAAADSGSLITARLARKRGRAVFAVPGSIGNPLSRGCHQLIRQGATLTESPHDILGELSRQAVYCGATLGEVPSRRADFSPAGMDKNRKILLDALGFDPADLDLLVGRTGLKPQAVSSMMLILELEGHVQAAPGGRYSRVVRSRR
jgi:DNA processing protein